MGKKNVIWICLLIIVGVLAVYNVVSDNKDKNEKEELASLMNQSYVIKGVKYLSYSQLKYIAMNELSHEDVQKVAALCGMTQTEIRDRYSDYRGDCGFFSLRTRNGDYVEYEFEFRPNSKEYMKMLKSEIKREEDAKEDKYSTLTTIQGYINDYWYVMLSYSFDKYNNIQFGVRFRHSTKKKFDRK